MTDKKNVHEDFSCPIKRGPKGPERAQRNVLEVVICTKKSRQGATREIKRLGPAVQAHVYADMLRVCRVWVFGLESEHKCE